MNRRIALTGAAVLAAASCLVYLRFREPRFAEGQPCAFEKECFPEHMCFEKVCRARDFVLARAQNACGSSKACKESGRCTAELSKGPQPMFDEDRWKCFARSDADCLGSNSCRSNKLQCKYNEATGYCGE